jgi:hypothetical protein
MYIQFRLTPDLFNISIYIQTFIASKKQNSHLHLIRNLFLFGWFNLDSNLIFRIHGLRFLWKIWPTSTGENNNLKVVFGFLGATRRNLQARPKILKKNCWNIRTNQNENFTKKVCSVSLKCKGAKNSYGNYQTVVAPGPTDFFLCQKLLFIDKKF